MAIKTRSQLKPYFVKNAIPTEGNFADLIDSALNQSEDGVIDGSLTVNDKLKVGAGSEVAAVTASGLITANGGLKVKGDAVVNGSLTVTGKFTAPGAAGLSLSGDTTVDGVLTANGLKSPYSLALSDYTTLAPASNVLLLSPPKDRDGWVYRDVTDTRGNSGIYHRQLDTAVKGLPANSLGFIGGSALKAYINMVTGGAYFAGNLALGAADPGANRLHVEGDARVQGDVAITGGLSLNGLTVNGPALARSGLSVTGMLAADILTTGTITLGQQQPSLKFPNETINSAGNGLRLAVAGRERLILANDGTLTLTFNEGRMQFNANGSITKHRPDGTLVATVVQAGW